MLLRASTVATAAASSSNDSAFTFVASSASFASGGCRPLGCLLPAVGAIASGEAAAVTIASTVAFRRAWPGSSMMLSVTGAGTFALAAVAVIFVTAAAVLKPQLFIAVGRKALALRLGGSVGMAASREASMLKALP